MASSIARLPFIRLLSALAHDEPLVLARPLSMLEVDWLVSIGCAPLIWHKLGGDPSAAGGAAHRLRAADLTARVLTGALIGHVRDVIARFADREIVPTLLKGIAHATGRYPEPHLRTMADVDLLIDEESLAPARSILQDAGFRVPEDLSADDYANHHHAPPMYHPDRGIWMELHTALLLPSFPASREEPFSSESLRTELRPAALGDVPVRRLSPECDLVYTAAGWCRDLTDAWAPGLQRPLVDATLLLARHGDSLDWDRILRWCQRSQTGVCLYVMLSYLARHGAWAGATELRRLRRAQHYASTGSAGVIHRLLDRYLVKPLPPGRIVTPNIAAMTVDNFIAPRRAWTRWMQLPLNLAFPSQEARRFEPGYQWKRLAGLFRSR